MSLNNSKRIFTTIKSKIESEKSYRNLESSIYTFLVRLDSTKTDIKFAFGKLYPDVNVVSIKTVVRKGKVKRSKRGFTKKINKKYAMLRLSGQLEKLTNMQVDIENNEGDLNGSN